MRFRNIDPDILHKAAQVQLAIFDIDGVMTDGSLHYGPDGEWKSFHTQDGLGFSLARKAGIRFAAISGRTSPATIRRLEELRFEHLILDQDEKEAAFDELLRETRLEPEATAYIGDDALDVPCICRAGLGVSVPNGHPSATAVAAWITPRPGGAGAARDLCDLLLETRR